MTTTPQWYVKLTAALIAAFLILPTLIVIGISFTGGNALAFPPQGFSLRWYEQFLNSPEWTDGLIASLQIAVLVTIFATILGTMTAVALVRGRIPFIRPVTALVFSPMIVPVVVIALGMYLTYGKVQFTGSMASIVVAHTTLAIPLVVINVAAGLLRVDWTLALAARSLGASSPQAFLRVIVPLMTPSIAAGALFAFMTSWDEVVVAIFLTSPQTKTLPVVMWDQMRLYIDPTIAAVASVLTLTTVIGLLLVALSNHRLQRVSEKR